MSREMVLFSDLSKKKREEIRTAIVEFCESLKTRKEIEKKFNLSGISAAAVMSNLFIAGRINFLGDKKRTFYLRRVSLNVKI